MDDKPNKTPAEARALTDEELDHASGGRNAYHGSGYTYACDECMVYLTERVPAKWVHRKCGKEMRRLQSYAERQGVRENPQYKEVPSDQAGRG